MNEIASLVTQVGFPIVACCVMWKQNNKFQDTLNDLSKTLELMNERMSNIERDIKDCKEGSDEK